MAGIAQLVRASDCDSEGSGFKSHHSPQNPVMLSKRAHVGNVSEVKVFAAYTVAGYFVFQPLGGGYPYDFVADDGERLWRVQVKTGRLLPTGAIVFYPRSNNGFWQKKGQANYYRTYEGKADLIAVYCPETDKVYVISPEGLGACAYHLRVHPPRNNQVKGIRLAADYELKPLLNPPLLGACEDDDELEGESDDEIESCTPLR